MPHTEEHAMQKLTPTQTDAVQGAATSKALTTLIVGEEHKFTTMIYGEEGHPPKPPVVTTLALGEEGGPVTTSSTGTSALGSF
jgi:hypothetical protein